MPRQSIFPALHYRDARQAIEFLERAFGARPHVVYDAEDGSVAHAEVEVAGNLIMLGQHADGREDSYGRAAPPPGSASLYVLVDDVDGLHARALAAGAEEVRAPLDTPYGSREDSVRDLDGNVWSFGTYDPRAAGA